MPNSPKKSRRSVALLLAVFSTAAWADDDEALDLQVEAPVAAQPPSTGSAARSTPRTSVLEVAALTGRDWLGAHDAGHRVAWDLSFRRSLGEPLRFRLSNRLENQEPTPAPRPQMRNHLRELALEWQDDSGRRSLEFGRVNLRHGSAYGYNPTDYFRHGATQSLVTVDPVALRRNRTGVVMVRGSQQWDGGGLEAVLAPRLSNGSRHDEPLSLGLEGTNASDRALAAVQWQPSERWSGEALVFAQSGRSPRLGMNFSGLVHDALVVHAEWSGGRMPSLLDLAAGTSSTARWQRQVSAGLTYTLSGGWALTWEGAFNSAGLRGADWPVLFARGSTNVARLFELVQADQELAQRRAWLLYLSKKGFLVKQLDLTGFVRQNRDDRSRLNWVELRYHWPTVDAALQWNRAVGSPTSEYGAFPVRDLVQIVGYYYF